MGDQAETRQQCRVDQRPDKRDRRARRAIEQRLSTSASSSRAGKRFAKSAVLESFAFKSILDRIANIRRPLAAVSATMASFNPLPSTSIR